MTIKLLKRLSLLFSSVIIIISQCPACGFYPHAGEYRFWIMNPGIVQNAPLAPFYFASNYNYMEWTETKVHYAENIDQWYTYLKGQADKKSIYEAQYDIDAMDFFTGIDSLVQVNSFLKVLQQPHYANEWEYFQLAKQTEMQAMYDPWYYSSISATVDTNAAGIISTHLRKAEKLYNKVKKNRLLKTRIAYQMIRLCLYSGKYEEGEKVYKEKFLPNVSKSSWIYGTGMFYRTLLTDKMDAAHYCQLVKVFDVTTNKRTAALRYFPSMGIDSILPLAQTNHERALIYVMRELQYNGPSLENLEKIYKLDPGNKELPFLIVRETGKIEDWLKTPEYTSDDLSPATYDDGWNRLFWERGGKLQKALQANREKEQRYAKSLHSFIDRLIAGKKQTDKNLLHICAAHVSLMLNKMGEAQKHISAVKTKSLKPEMELQVMVEQLMINIASKPYFDEADKTLYLKTVQTPDSKLPTQHPDIYKNQLTLFVGRTVMAHKDTAQAVLLLGRTTRAIGMSPLYGMGYADALTYLSTMGSPAVYDEIMAMLHKKDKSPYEQFITQKAVKNPWWDDDFWPKRVDDTSTDGYTHVWSTEKMLDLKATWYINHDELDSALEILNKIPPAYWKLHPYVDYMTGDPFYTKVAQSIKEPYNILRPTGAKSITKPEYIETILYLKKCAENMNGETKALVMLRIAEAYFQMSYYGEYWMMNRTYWSMHEEIKSATTFDDMYYSCTLAKDWYMKALHYATSEKTAATTAAMARYCDRLYLEHKNMPAQPHATDRITALLERKFKTHPYFDMILDECP